MIPAPAPVYSLESLRRTVRSLTVELLAVYEELALLYSVSGQIGRLADETQIAAVALKEALEISAADCGWVALWDGDSPRVHESCRAGIARRTIEEVHRVVLEPLFQTGKQDFVSHALRQEYGISDAEAPSRFLASALALEGRSRGYLCLGRRETGAVFLSPDQKLISAVALLLAVELENVRLQRSEFDKQRLVNELELARTIQQSLLPRDFSRIAFLDAAGVSEPCCEIGGDFFDLIPIDSDRCTLIIADVSGKGPPAALQAAMVQGIVNAVSRTCPELPFLMSTLNACLLNRPAADRFVTAFAAALDRSGRLRYANAGHPAPLWIRRNGEVVELGQSGPLLGVFPRSEYSQASVQLAPGDLLVMYTDGLTEARDWRGRAFGAARLLDWARRQNGLPPDEVQRDLTLTVQAFCDGCRQEDDCSVLVVQYSGAKGPTLTTR
jgi:serine phosphatase RsbU (regulator of sigma subunit)